MHCSMAWLLLTWLLQPPPAARAFELAACRLPLGVTSGQIKDDAMTASSSYDENNTGPQNGRVNVERAAGAWCPGPPVSRGAREYLQVTLAGEFVISAVLTQGRYGGGRGVEYTKAFTLEYWRTGVGWRNYTRWDGQHVLPGNVNVASVKETRLLPPLTASRVRFLPYSLHSRTVCLRVELLGCRRTDGIRSYSVRQGDRYSRAVSLRDLSFDGEFRRGFLSRGLGQLTDGLLGGDRFLDDLGHGRGYDWVGWTSQLSQRYPVEITVQFDQRRNFSHLSLHTAVHYSGGVEMFTLARVFFSDGGRLYRPAPALLYPRAVRADHETRLVTVDLGGRPGRYAKIQLFFRARWILISELQITSDPCDRRCGSAGEEGMTIPHTEVWKARPQDISKIMSLSGPEEPEAPFSGHWGLLVGVLTALGLAALLGAGVLYWRATSHKSNCLTYNTFSRPYTERSAPVSTKGESKKHRLVTYLSEARGGLLSRLDIAAGQARDTHTAVVPEPAAGGGLLPPTGGGGLQPPPTGGGGGGLRPHPGGRRGSDCAPRLLVHDPRLTVDRLHAHAHTRTHACTHTLPGGMLHPAAAGAGDDDDRGAVCWLTDRVHRSAGRGGGEAPV